jgi:hypothetical protein
VVLLLMGIEALGEEQLGIKALGAGRLGNWASEEKELATRRRQRVGACERAVEEHGELEGAR